MQIVPQSKTLAVIWNLIILQSFFFVSFLLLLLSSQALARHSIKGGKNTPDLFHSADPSAWAHTAAQSVNHFQTLCTVCWSPLVGWIVPEHMIFALSTSRPLAAPPAPPVTALVFAHLNDHEVPPAFLLCDWSGPVGNTHNLWKSYLLSLSCYGNPDLGLQLSAVALRVCWWGSRGRQLATSYLNSCAKWTECLPYLCV